MVQPCEPRGASGGEAQKRACEVQILTICAKRGEPLTLAMGKARLKVRQ
nr:MAG TPA: hypothetical protein [Caudoviricetes sp.]